MTNMPKNTRGGVWRKQNKRADPVCTRCQHRTCVCKPRERTFTESQVRAVLQAEVATHEWELRVGLCSSIRTEARAMAWAVRRAAKKLGIDLGQD